MLISEFGEYGGVWDYTKRHFLRILQNQVASEPFSPPKQFTDELLWWDRDDTRQRQPRRATAWRSLREGRSSGPLYGGCIPTLNLLVGTPYLPDFEGAMIFLEDEEMPLDKLQSHLIHLKLAGVFRRPAGILIGRAARPLPSSSGFSDRNDLILSVLGDINCPVLVNVDLGHTEPMLTLPLGVQCALDTHSSTPIRLLEAGVKQAEQ